MSTASPSERSVKTWPDYRAVWRWHFYASLFSMPFVILLSLTGAVYLFKPQIEAWNDRHFDQLTAASPATTPAQQVQAAIAAFPGSSATAYELPPSEHAAARVIVRNEGQATRVYVHPGDLSILHSVPEDQRLMRTMFRLHGELLMGDRGSNIVELAACWTIVMLLTGLFLWWPRNANGMGGVLYPRLRMGNRIFWRDIHSVTGMWISFFALFLLATGLPWAKFWGTYFKEVRRVTGTAVVQQDWTVGSERSGGGEHAGHGGSPRAGGRRGAGPGMPHDLEPLNRVVAAVTPLNLPDPIVVAAPAAGSKDWSAKSMTGNRPKRVNLTVDGSTGAITSREDFKDRHWVDRIVGIGIAAHEGQLFGWLNQLLGLMTAGGLILLSVSGVILWWRRREVGVLGAPKMILNPRFSPGLVAIIVLLGAYLPMFGASLLLVLILEWAVLCRIPPVRDWLGLKRPTSAAVLGGSP
ncbi:PepSY-associated TM helix [Caulifigura coniformis]|uniref:PepSY-associated TM helix n=1 Tax=Caulifigura coniformis TaxID=2527983 RepID=A0A517SBI8_9PLAN|nr:PepSY domain-containing protein [Caulifigura coniformis]QDT53500.1 PepSY-associated TM helix [Caulifigura coniformis]